MNPELEKLIDFALADGQLTEKEKQVLFKKAEALGVDQDEFEMVLEGKLHLVQKAMNQSNSSPQTQVQQAQTQSNKEGSLKKCPSCGAHIQAFATRCSDCGHDFQNVESNASVKKLFELLNEAEKENRTETLYGKLQSSFLNTFLGASDLDKKKMEIISSFPIPNTKGDILEFLSLAIPKAKTAGNFFTKDNAENKIHNAFAQVWKTKCEQIIMKARFSMKDDKKTLEEIEHYAKQLGIK